MQFDNTIIRLDGQIAPPTLDQFVDQLVAEIRRYPAEASWIAEQICIRLAGAPETAEVAVDGHPLVAWGGFKDLEQDAFERALRRIPTYSTETE